MKSIKIISVVLFILIVSSYFPLYACTGIYATDSDDILVGNNEDWNDPCTKIWFLPPEKGKYGRVFVGYCNLFPQGGMNEKGLYVDGFATSPVKVKNSKHKKKLRGSIMQVVIEKCATVDEALKFLDQYDLSDMEKWNMFICDAHGNSVILEGDDIVRKNGRFQICTNFHQSKMTSVRAKCGRYKKAWQMLYESKSISVEHFKNILDETHAEGLYSTQYSNICDLKNRKLYLYHFHNFDDVLEFDLMEMMKDAPVYYDMPELFDENPKFAAYNDDLTNGIERRISKRLLENPDRSNWSDFVGKYKIPEGAASVSDYLFVELQDDKLIGYSDKNIKIELLPESVDRFFYLTVGYDLTIEFVRDTTGNVTHVNSIVNGKKIVCKKVD